MSECEPLRAERREALLHCERHRRGTASRLGDRERVVEEDQDPVAREAVDRPLVRVGDDAHRRMVVAQHRLHFLRLGMIGNGGEPAQVGEHVGDLPPMRREDRALAGGDDRVGDFRREEPLQLRQPLHLRDLFGDALLELRVPRLELVGLAPHLVLQRLHAQQRAHAREELGLVDRLRQEVVGARLDALERARPADRAR